MKISLIVAALILLVATFTCSWHDLEPTLWKLAGAGAVLLAIVALDDARFATISGVVGVAAAIPVIVAHYATPFRWVDSHGEALFVSAMVLVVIGSIVPEQPAD